MIKNYIDFLYGFKMYITIHKIQHVKYNKTIDVQ